MSNQRRVTVLPDLNRLNVNQVLVFLIVTLIVWAFGLLLLQTDQVDQIDPHHDHFQNLYDESTSTHAPVLEQLRTEISQTKPQLSTIDPPPSVTPGPPVDMPFQPLGQTDRRFSWKTKLPNPAVVVLSYNRKQYLEWTLRSLMNTPGVENFKVFVSQDGDTVDFRPVVNSFNGHVTLLHHPRNSGVAQPGTAFLAQHYKGVFGRLFDQMGFSHVIVCEDDMLFAPDFLYYFEQTAPLLAQDPTLWCISSWNDLGMKEYVNDPARLFRTHYFPGLGWLMRKELWDEIKDKWPSDHWDHWMRTDGVSKGRECVVPEVSRNYNIGEQGTNMEGGAFYKNFLARIALSHQITRLGDLSYLLHDNYEAQMNAFVRSAKYLCDALQFPSTLARLRHEHAKSDHPVYLVTHTLETFRTIANTLRIHHAPRTQSHGTIIIKIDGAIYIFADRRESPYIPDHLKLRMDSRVVPTKGELGADCTSTCSQAGMKCESSHIPFLNSCQLLMKYFPCENGCRGGVVGTDLPNYVDAPKKPDFHQACLTSEQVSGCDGKHWSSRRLCPCMKA